jgi:hypothetical protein
MVISFSLTNYLETNKDEDILKYIDILLKKIVYSATWHRSKVIYNTIKRGTLHPKELCHHIL